MAPETDTAALSDVVARAAYATLVSGAEAWARLNLTMPQLKVLLLLAPRSPEGAPVSWLASRMQVSPPNVTGILDRLEHSGWVRRAGDARDRRIVRVLLTGEGQHLLSELRAASAAAVVAAIDMLDATERAALATGLTALLLRLEGAANTVAPPAARPHLNGGRTGAALG